MTTPNPPRIIAVDLGRISGIAISSCGVVRTQVVAAGTIADAIRAAVSR